MVNERVLGTGRMAMAPIALGCMGMSQGYGHRDDNTSIATIHRAIERGITLIDTATTYGLGHNERLVGRALRGRRDRVLVSTKFGIVRDRSRSIRVDGSPANARVVCEQSLRRLDIDHIDLYFLHRVDPAVPVEESIGAMAELVAEGKVRHLGISEATPDQLARGASMYPITALQSEWSLWCRDIEDKIVPVARDHGVGLMPYSVLGRGFLAGVAPAPDGLGDDDWRRRDERFNGADRARNDHRLRQLADLARDLKVSLAQLTLAWTLAQGPDVVPVVGMTRPERVDENLAAAEIALSDEALERLSGLAAPGTWSGASSSFRRAATMSPGGGAA